VALTERYGVPNFEEIEGALTFHAPRRWGLRSSNGLTLALDPAASALWLIWPAGEGLLPSVGTTTVLEAAALDIGGERHFRLGARSPTLLREVFYFLSGIVHRAESTGESLIDAIQDELAAWEALLSQPPMLDRNLRTGLLGELWVLWSVFRDLGVDAIESWTGPLSEQHDFRLAEEDLEVKTTLSTSREHTISGVGQLVADGCRPLSVISVQLKPAGNGPGVSLNEAVEKFRVRLAGDHSALANFNRKIASAGYRHVESDRERYCLRSRPQKIPVDELFPRLTAEDLSSIVGADRMQRICKVIYTVNLDGLGLPLEVSRLHDSSETHEDGELYD
jgi:hypothetical protein